jgi:CubicO group peptidase (beta-lactamase class C family)
MIIAHDWIEASPKQHGIDVNLLTQLHAHVRTKMPHVQSVLVARHGELVYEQYADGYNHESLHIVASITKSVTSLLVGIAIDKGFLSGVDLKIVDRFPHHIITRDSRTQLISLHHLLSMTAGFDWTDQNVAQWLSDSAPRFPLRSEMATEPGTSFNYDTPSSHLLSAIVFEATGKTLLEFADAFLFAPLDIVHRKWESDVEGYSYGGHGLALRTRDLLKLGQLVLQNGEWRGKPIVSAKWIEESTRVHSEGYPGTFGAYGYLWWLLQIKGIRTICGSGFGGQFLYIFPERELVVAITSKRDKLHAENKQIVRDFVLPACG